MADSRLPPPGFPAEIPSAATLNALHQVMVRCTRCDLFLSRTRVVPGVGPGAASILVVGEAPGRREDEAGVPFVGRSGMLLDAMLEGAGLSRAEVFIGNVVRCRPPGNRSPRSAEIRACAGWLRAQVRLVGPRVVVTLGRFALQHFLPGYRVSDTQGEIRWVTYDDRPFALYPLLHPAAIIRNPPLRPAYAAQFVRLAAIARTLSEGRETEPS